MKKFDRAVQWTKEKVGKDNRTTVTDEFKMMETEMQMRHEGMEKLHATAQTYIKSLSKRREGDDKEKMTPVDIVGQSMVMHGEEFESDSQYGQCLVGLGHANESIARIQETYVESISETWLLSLERSLAQMKEYQAARKKLESRRLAYDATLSKMQKQKKEDFRVEDELRSQRIKYEESNEDVTRRMGDIQEAEADTMEDLSAFLESELEYYEKCRNVLLRVKQQWPAQPSRKRPTTAARSRSNTFNSFQSRELERTRTQTPPPPVPEARPIIRSRSTTSGASYSEYDRQSQYSERGATPDLPLSRPTINRVNSASGYHERSSPPPGARTLLRNQSDVLPPPTYGRANLRTTGNRPRVDTDNSDVFADDNLSYSPEKSYANDLSSSPATSVGSQGQGRRLESRGNSSTNLAQMNSRKAAPPPPPSGGSRLGKKAPPPPPPIKRATLSAANVHDR